MSKLGAVTGYVVSVTDDCRDSQPAFAFGIYVPSECKSDPYENQEGAEEGHHYFSIKKIEDNRELVWVSLLRDAMIHRLSATVTYRYTTKADPGSGEIVSIDMECFAFQPGYMKSVKVKVADISIGEYFVWGNDLKIPATDVVDAACIYPEGGGVYILPLFGTNKETALAQLNLLQLAWEKQCNVTITYKILPKSMQDEYTYTVMGVRIHNT
jgi:hypothetical protein